MFSIAAAVVVLLAVTIGILVIPRPAAVYASATPPLLQPTPINGTSEQLLMDLSSSLKDGETTSTVQIQSWALSMDVGNEGVIEKVSIEPEVRSVVHTSEGSRLEVRRGKPYDSDGRPIQVDGYQVGELIWARDYGPGEFPFMFGPAPVSPLEFGDYLRRPSGAAEWTTGEYIGGLTSVLNERRLTADQSKAALEFLAGLPELNVEGRVMDRLGRSGIAFATETRAPGEFVDRVIVSDEGLGILSVETTYVGHDRTDIQAPAVFSYFAWE
ncbi:hypothetical protein ATC03_00140 [Agromyces aureus]|uniref:Uncharacterized protein n=1 Tax=Agromyces aureus TaxID=453304 RepID=A0A191WB57_9MICO|nr:hypothetical protein ATC03_00140 [Agromyces aureus]